MRICYIANYRPDRQESMIRFANWLDRVMRDRGLQTEVLYPKAIMIHLVGGKTPLAKWLGYIDKFILFPLFLRWHGRLRKNRDVIYHVVDHSNAVYANCLPGDRTLLTCHDVLAIRGGLGDTDSYCTPSITGRVLQWWIKRHLHKCPHIVFVSHATYQDYLNLPTPNGRQKASAQINQIIYNGLNHDFTKIPDADAVAILKEINVDPGIPYFFHVGSDHPRKNRIGILAAFNKFMAIHPDYQVIFAGVSFSQREQSYLDALEPGKHRVQHVGEVSHEKLVALYSRAVAFVFPSFSEGFGWPIIEAQSCGCPVIYGNRTSLPEVAGDTGLPCDPASPESISSALLSLVDPTVKEGFIQKGYLNIRRFDPQVTSEKYLEIYRNKYSEQTSPTRAVI